MLHNSSLLASALCALFAFTVVSCAGNDQGKGRNGTDANGSWRNNTRPFPPQSFNNRTEGGQKNGSRQFTFPPPPPGGRNGTDPKAGRKNETNPHQFPPQGWGNQPNGTDRRPPQGWGNQPNGTDRRPPQGWGNQPNGTDRRPPEGWGNQPNGTDRRPPQGRPFMNNNSSDPHAQRNNRTDGPQDHKNGTAWFPWPPPGQGQWNNSSKPHGEQDGNRFGNNGTKPNFPPGGNRNNGTDWHNNAGLGGGPNGPPKFNGTMPGKPHNSTNPDNNKGKGGKNTSGDNHGNGQ